MYDLNLDITVPTDVLAPCGAWSSAASVLTMKWDVKMSWILKISKKVLSIRWHFSNLPMRSCKISDIPVVNKIKNQFHGTLPISMQVLPNHQTNPCYTVQKQLMPYCFPCECLPIRLTKGKVTTQRTLASEYQFLIISDTKTWNNSTEWNITSLWQHI